MRGVSKKLLLAVAALACLAVAPPASAKEHCVGEEGVAGACVDATDEASYTLCVPEAYYCSPMPIVYEYPDGHLECSHWRGDDYFICRPA